MTAVILTRNEKSFTLQIEVPVDSDNMLSSEDLLQDALNEGGRLATGELLQRFEVPNHDPVVLRGQKLTYKHQVAKRYETPYGVFTFERAVYQGHCGGVTWSPLDHNAHIIGAATPKLAKMVSWKYSKIPAPAVAEDLESNHGRKLALSYIKHLSDAVGFLVEDHTYDEYDIPKLDEPVSSIAIGLDGTCMLLCEGGWREAMCGTISLYDASGHRQYTIYTAAAPEYGKSSFLGHLEHEIRRIKDRFPNAHYIGIADGAKSNWCFLKKHTDYQTLDFFHVSEYIGAVAQALFPVNEKQREAWLEDRLHRLKHKMGAASRLLRELEAVDLPKKTTANVEKLYKAISYMKNNQSLMRYYQSVSKNWPIGSGVTEAACKTLVKQRLCGSGMRWKHQSAAIILGIRALSQTKERWEQFWERFMAVHRANEPVSAF
ncbi:ISKra4 family transposase [Endozoicomonas acroporae]